MEVEKIRRVCTYIKGIHKIIVRFQLTFVHKKNKKG